MPGLLAIPAAAAVAGLALAAVPLSAPAGAQPAECAGDQVTVVVDFNELGGGTRVACADEEGTAAELFEGSGFPLTYTRAPGMQGFVCGVSGKPVKGPCTEGDSYWSLWWTDGSGDWAYATLGAGQLEVPRGGHVGFAWHEGDVDAAPPDVTVAGGSVEPGEGEDVAAGAPEPDRASPDDTGFPTWAAVGLGVVVLGAAAVVPLVRRRSS